MLDARTLLLNLDLSESEIDVYLVMLKGARTARDIIKATGRSRPTVYYALTALERRGLLSKTGLPEERRYRVESPKRLKAVLDDKEKAIQAMRLQLDELVASQQKLSPADTKPQVAFYEGVAAVRSVIMETIYTQKRQIDTLVPSDNFFWQLGSEFVEQYVELRHTLGVHTRNLWGKGIRQEVINEYYDKSEIRMLPDGLGDRFRTTIFMYDDCVLYISSLASGYCLHVRSVEQREVMQVMYDSLWSVSRPLSHT